MQSNDLRRLVTTFLVLALLAGSATLAVTSLARQRSESPAAIAKNLAREQLANSAPKIGDKALIESMPGNGSVQGYDLAAEFSPTISAKDNFTDTFAKGLAYEFVTTNPEGPLEGLGVAPPTNLEEITNEYVMDAAMTPTTYPIDESRVRVAKSYTADQAQGYLASLDTALTQASGERGLEGLTNRTSLTEIDEAALQASSFIISDAQDKIYALTAPGPAEELHRSLLSYLELNRKLSEPDYATDPLKAVVFATKFPELRAQEEIRLQLAMADFERDVPQMMSDAREPFLVASMLGARTAHAQWLVSDIKHLIATIANGVGVNGTWATALQEWIRKVATQVLKNQIIGRMIQQTVKWVQGGGKPQFITNWKGFLKNAGQDAADSVLSYVAPQLCSNFSSFAQPSIRAMTSSERPQQVITCTLSQVIQNIRSFYDDFTNGGWAGLLTLIEPANNLYGAIIAANESVIGESVAQAGAAKAEADANDGFKGFKRCVSFDLQVVPRSQVAAEQKKETFAGLGPRGCFSQAPGAPTTSDSGGFVVTEEMYFQCQPDPTQGICDIILSTGIGGTVRTGSGTTGTGDTRGAVQVCEIKVCKADGQQTTTPGGAVAGQLEKALGASLDNIVNAEDLAGLAGVVIDAAITRLIGLAEKGILGMFGGSDPSGTTGGSPTGGSTGTGTGAGDDISAIKNQGLQLVDSVQTRVNQASTTASAWSPTASSTQPILVSVRMTCLAYTADVEQRLGAIDRIGPLSEADRTALGAVGDDIRALRTSVTTATSAIAIANLLGNMDALNARATTLVSRIEVRGAQIEGLRNSAQANIANRACNVPLPSLDE